MYRAFASYVDVSTHSCKSLVNTLHKVRPWKRLVILKVQTRWFPTWQPGFLGRSFTRPFQKCLSRWTQLRCTERTLNLSEDCRRWTFHLHGKMGGKARGTGLGGDKKVDYYSKDSNNNKGCVCHFQLLTLLWYRLDWGYWDLTLLNNRSLCLCTTLNRDLNFLFGLLMESFQLLMQNNQLKKLESLQPA